MNLKDIKGLVSPPDIFACKKVLCIQPHPDDNEVGMGGIIPKLVCRGIQVDYLTMTNGNLGLQFPNDDPKALVKTRNKELEASGRFLGVTNFYSLNHDDGSLQDVSALSKEIGTVIREGQYDGVFAPDPWIRYEAHWDHVVTGRAAAHACIGASLPQFPLGSKTKPTTLKAIGFYLTDRPNVIINIKNTYNQKMKAMAMHKSQFDDETMDLYRIYFNLHGRMVSWKRFFTLGESLRVFAPFHMHCFVHAKRI